MTEPANHQINLPVEDLMFSFGILGKNHPVVKGHLGALIGYRPFELQRAS
jgi:hypothetical protein